MDIDYLEKEIAKIHKSTRTLFRPFLPLHNKLRVKFRWYNKWHLNPYHRHVHYSVLGVSIMIVASLVFSTLFVGNHRAKAIGSTASVGGTATVANSNGQITFATNGSNVLIDNATRKFSGYAWSNDLGWIDFGNTGSDPANPVVANITGDVSARHFLLSGKAKVLNTGAYIDFSSPSNVEIAAGIYSGYAWSDDMGWIDFSAVTASNYNPDLTFPTNPSVTAKSTSGGATLTADTWYNYSAPYFSWTTPADNSPDSNPTEYSSGVAGYYVYFGTTGSTDPSSYQTGINFTSPALGSNFGTYYFRIKTIDVAGNVSSPITLFTYKYENAAPTAPAYVSVTPSGYSRTNTFTFSWPVTGGSAATDTGGSGLLKYQYKINSESNWHDVTGDATTANITLSDVATTSINTFDLQAVDLAGNASSTATRTNFLFNDTAPLAPPGPNGGRLAVTPVTSTTNSFSFTWFASPGEIDGYYYSVNSVPTLENALFTTNTSLPADSYATQKDNILYVVAKDNAGNYDFSGCSQLSVNYNPNVDTCAAVAFTASVDTNVPGIPGGIQAYDASDRNTKEYAVTVRWTKPVQVGDNFAAYDIYRSDNSESSYSLVGAVSNVNNTIYSETNLESKIYFYYVKTRDSFGQTSAASSSSSITPTGRFTSPPKLVSGPTVTIAPTSITVSWVTDRVCSSFVQIKDGNIFVSEQGQTEQTTNHEVKVVGLRSQRDYVFNIKSTDIDGNTLNGDDQKFTTANTPSVYDLNISNITQESAIINFKSTAIANFTLYYGATASYGKTVSESSSSATTNHSLALSSLIPGQMYYFRVTGDDADGNELRSENSFSTLPMPAISKFGIQLDKEAPSTTLKISWQTNVPTTSTVKYSTDGVTFHEQSASDLVIDHEITISDLADKSKYIVYAMGRDQFGNIAESDKVSFDTPVDTRPPKISDIIIESSNIGNSSDKAQVVISWKTDEPANSQIEYDTGLSGEEYTRKTSLDGTFTSHHLVIISDLDPGKPYHLRILSADMAGNLSKSGDSTVISGEVSRSALQMILNTLQNIFGWMGKWMK